MIIVFFDRFLNPTFSVTKKIDGKFDTKKVCCRKDYLWSKINSRGDVLGSLTEILFCVFVHSSLIKVPFTLNS